MKRYFSINSSEDIVVFLYNNTVSGLTTAGFSTLYAKLPQNVVFDACAYLISLAYRNFGKVATYRATNGYVIFGDNIKVNNSCKFYTKAEVISLVRNVVKEAYVDFAQEETRNWNTYGWKCKYGVSRYHPFRIRI